MISGEGAQAYIWGKGRGKVWSGKDRLLESRRSRDDSGHGASMGLMLYHRNLRFSGVETRRFNGWEGEGGQSLVEV